MSGVSRLRRLFFYTPPDPVGFWRDRATDAGWLSVMWANTAYNEMAHADQWKAIESNLPGRRGAVLDLGCGTGRLSARLAGLFDNYVGVDLDTMVREARNRNPELNAAFVSASVQQYEFPRERYDLVLSMACLASACRAEELPEIARRIVGATRAGGRIIMIDPYHTFPALTRTCRLGSREVIEIFTRLGATLRYWGGTHFFPARLVLARSFMSRFGGLTRAGYKAGEMICSLSPRLLSDYKVLVLSKE